MSGCREVPEISFWKKYSPYPRVDWKETREAHVFNAEIPGLKKEAVKLAITDDRVLEISGEQWRKEEKQEGEKYHCAERFDGSFLKRFYLPENAKGEEAKASMGNGVLTVIVPKNPHSNPLPELIDIEISG